MDSLVPSSLRGNTDNDEWTGNRDNGDNGDQSMPTSRFHPSPRSARDFRQALSLLHIAKSNSVFEVICKSLDDRNSKFHLMATPFVTPSVGEPKVAKILKDALYHCQGKIFKTNREEELRKSETNLRDVQESLKKVRELYAMKQIKDLNWTFD